MRLGVLVNPIAGMGGRIGLKGTDGKVAEARQRGAEPRAPERARRVLDRLAERDPSIEIVTAGAPMGADAVRAAGFDPRVVYEPAGPSTTIDDIEQTESSGDTDTTAGDSDTTAADTREAVEAFVDNDVELVLFVGGDGTAADVAEALSDTVIPLLGVPAGVKVYSSVFAVSPEAAADIVVEFDRIEQREVMDIDEEDYRAGEVSPELRAVASVPVADGLQSAKQRGGGSVEALAEGVASGVDPETTYVLGPGSTMAAIKSALGFEGSPLGVDVWRDGEVLAVDASEDEILAAMGEQNTIIVSPIGGQGFVFGRGNPQLSPEVIRQADVEVVASRSKLDDLRALRVDTDDPELDADLSGWQQVRVGKFETRMLKIV
ncbi:N-acetylglucosamine-1-phosphate uridyltransferase [Halonotius terrestris]|uniref:N-acetylglucosamine-1-phosphate uridyltransferase n=1 Tax=Halonotius terrestris TaxID=2487750 RepID=A0A8J8TBX6_9EURY|nr:ATP-NAD kinase family protein [Halonotius terrestris]TQQ79851.1 N-acetylglucosamine-1-phosphate uridyltransferase [Halonotius terrestris]